MWTVEPGYREPGFGQECRVHHLARRSRKDGDGAAGGNSIRRCVPLLASEEYLSGPHKRDVGAYQP